MFIKMRKLIREFVIELDLILSSGLIEKISDLDLEYLVLNDSGSFWGRRWNLAGSRLGRSGYVFHLTFGNI